MVSAARNRYTCLREEERDNRSPPRMVFPPARVLWPCEALSCLVECSTLRRYAPSSLCGGKHAPLSSRLVGLPLLGEKGVLMDRHTLQQAPILVLVPDDELRLLLEEMLREEGYQVSVAASLAEGLAWV